MLKLAYPSFLTRHRMALVGFGSVFVVLGKIFHRESKEYIIVKSSCSCFFYLNISFEVLDR